MDLNYNSSEGLILHMDTSYGVSRPRPPYSGDGGSDFGSKTSVSVLPSLPDTSRNDDDSDADDTQNVSVASNNFVEFDMSGLDEENRYHRRARSPQTLQRTFEPTKIEPEEPPIATHNDELENEEETLLRISDLICLKENVNTEHYSCAIHTEMTVDIPVIFSRAKKTIDPNSKGSYSYNVEKVRGY